MSIRYVKGDLFLSHAQTLAHGVNCRGRMGAGIAVGFRRRFPEMYQEYRRRCHKGAIIPGSLFLWKQSTPWILNMATQDKTGGADPRFVEECLTRLANEYSGEGITSLALPRIAAGLGKLSWHAVKGLVDSTLSTLSIPVIVYEEYVEGIAAREGMVSDKEVGEGSGEPVLFWQNKHPQWRALSNCHVAPIVIEGKEYASVEHYFQAGKATSDWEHEMVRNTIAPAEAKKVGRDVRLRPDWESVKMRVMRQGLLEKFRQHADLRRLLLSTRNRPIHEDSPHDAEWGWMKGSGKDRLGRLLVDIRRMLREEVPAEDGGEEEG